MILASILLSAQTVAAPIPGGCTEPAYQNVGKPGCFLSTELPISPDRQALYWHISEFPDEASARSAIKQHRWSTVVAAHGRWWLYVLSAQSKERLQGQLRGVVGPFKVNPNQPIIARFMESTFPPDMRTRIHSHSGPEGFFVIEGEQCVSTPNGQATIGAWEGKIVEEGPHLQASLVGRKSLVLVLATPGQPWMKLEDAWSSSPGCS